MPDSRTKPPIPTSDEALDREIREFLGLRKPRRRHRGWRLALLPVRIFILAVLPFWALIRGSVFAYYRFALNGWVALACGALLAALVLTVYGAVVAKKLTGKMRLRAVGTGVVLPAVIAFCTYSLIYLSSTNAKTEEVRAYYRSVHPLLRVAASTVILVDADVTITGLGRTPDDYLDMGLTPLQSSLHYEQDDGFVHAMDLRTLGRSEWRNRMTEWYFRSMGFRILRHVGNADHLHVALPSPIG